MSSHRQKTDAFTIIELLAVIAVIAILGSILIPATRGVIRQARIASYKSTLWQYTIAIEKFKAEYNYYPQVYGPGGNGNGLISLEGVLDSQNFVETLSGRIHNTGAPTTQGGNYRQIPFYSFSEKEFRDNGGGNYSTNRLSDPFNNTSIFIMIDLDGDGNIRPFSDDPESPGQIKGTITAWVVANGDLPGYALWE